MKGTEHVKRRSSVPVSAFFESVKSHLHLELDAGERGMERLITEATINRPGLALSGFFEYFAFRRVQVVGMAEHAYLMSLGREDQNSRLRDFFGRKIPCVVVTRDKKVLPEIRSLADEFDVPVFRTRMITKDFVNAATIVMENLMAPRMTVQGTMVEIMGIGVLIEGKPGMGKSEAALGLIKKGYAIVSDDVTSLRMDSAGALIGSPLAVTRYHMEIRGLGIIHVPSLFGVASVREEKKLDMVVTLCKQGTREEENRDGDAGEAYSLLGVEIPRVFIPVAPGRELANIIETAALNQRLKRLGHDAAKELDEKLMKRLSSGGTDASE